MITASIFFVIAYLAGSLSSAIITCKLMGLPDPRTQGSNNPGATNVLRIGGKYAALVTLVGDVFKGFIPVLLAGFFGVKGWSLGVVALATFVGHVFPLFFKFQGGKGVATAFGALFALSWVVGVVVLITWIAVVTAFRYVSLASLIAAGLTPLYLVLIQQYDYLAPILLLVIILFWRHWSNIQRLRAGTESKIHLFA